MDEEGPLGWASWGRVVIQHLQVIDAVQDRMVAHQQAARLTLADVLDRHLTLRERTG